MTDMLTYLPIASSMRRTDDPWAMEPAATMMRSNDAGTPVCSATSAMAACRMFCLRDCVVSTVDCATTVRSRCAQHVSMRFFSDSGNISDEDTEAEEETK